MDVTQASAGPMGFFTNEMDMVKVVTTGSTDSALARNGAISEMWQGVLATAPEDVSDRLERLCALARATDATATWVVALRGLAYYDRREGLRDAVAQAVGRTPLGGGALQLAVAEASLECALADEVSLDTVDPDKCAPVQPEVARLWRDWLKAESRWCLGEASPGEAIEKVEALLRIGSSCEDPESVAEQRRLVQRTAVLGARCAVSRQDAALATHYLELAERTGADLWETRDRKSVV